MAVYKVPQDVEADDKLVGPFTFRQLCYLFIAAGLIALAVAIGNIFPLLAVIPAPFIIFLLILALPLKKDQPMETYLAALINFYLKPSKRFWNPGQRESTITITAPKKLEGPRIRAISEDEASHRLSFLADIVDSNGQSIRENWSSSIQEEYIDEAANTPDMFENYDAQTLTTRATSTSDSKHTEAVEKMRAAIAEVEGQNSLSSSIPAPSSTTPSITHGFNTSPSLTPTPSFNPSVPSSAPASSTIIQPTPTISNSNIPASTENLTAQITVSPNPSSAQTPTSLPLSNEAPTIPPTVQPISLPNPNPAPENPARTAAIEQLSQNNDYKISTIANEANRIKNNNQGEVFISLH